MPSLKQLDSIFDSIWLMPDKLPEALAQWQALLEVYIADSEQVDTDGLTKLMTKWQIVMSENKLLFESHQKDLAEKLREGEQTFLKSKGAKQFKGH